MPINWQDTTIWERLFTALLASNNNKIETAEVARLFGEGMTYHALENQLRKVKKEATKMREDAVGRECPSGPAKPRGKKAGVAAVKATGAVKTGRVTKKQAPKSKVKVEEVADEEMDSDNINVYRELEGGDSGQEAMDAEDTV